MASARRAATSLLRLTPAMSSSAREAPTPVALLGGPWQGASSFQRMPLLRALSVSGFGVAALDLPGYGRANGLPADASLDDVVDGVHTALAALRGPPPIMIAHSSAALLAQKYLESYPLGGLVLLCPPPPCPSTWLQRHTGGDSEALSVARITAALRGMRLCPGDPGADADAGVTDDDAEAAELLQFVRDCRSDAEAALLDAASPPSGDNGPSQRSLCGLAAGARLLQLVCADPVRVEPSPVPLLIVRGLCDDVVSEAEAAETVAFHGLTDADGEDVHLERSAGHACMYGDAATERSLSDA